MSYYHQVSDNPFTSSTIHALCDSNTAKFPSKDALVLYNQAEERRSLSFQDLQTQSLNLAKSFLENGFQRSERVAVILPNCVEFVPICLALSRIGANTVLFTYGLSAEPTAHIYLKNQCSKLIVHTALGGDFVGQLRRLVEPEVPQTAVFTVGEGTLADTVSCQSWVSTERQDYDAVYKIQNKIQADDPAFILLTSGSTGEPKGAQHSHFTLINSALLARSAHGLGEETVIFNDRPMGWIAAVQPGLMLVLLYGATWVSTCGVTVHSPHISMVCRIMQRERCTHSLALVYMIYDLIHFAELGQFDLSAMRYALTGGQPVARESVRELIKRLPGLSVITMYGSTEGQVFVAYQRSASEAESQADYLTAQPHIEMKVVNEQCETVPSDQPGELCLRGPGLLLRYTDEAANEKHFSSGRWFHTDDSARLTSSGELRILGRRGDIIRRACDSVFPAAVEATFTKHPGVKQVIVVGVPDERNYEEVCACVIMHEGYDVNSPEMKAWCDQNFETFEGGFSMRPKHLLSVEKYPLTSSGKIDRRAVKTMAMKMLGL